MALSSHSQIRKPGSCTPGHISALKYGSGTHQPPPPLSFTPSRGCPLRTETLHKSNGSYTSFHHINRAAAKTCSAPEAGGLQHRDNCYEQTTDQTQRPARVWGEKSRCSRVCTYEDQHVLRADTSLPITYWGK